MIIAIDGPAGAGKSTVAKRLAKRLEFLYIDTGALYRALALKTIELKLEIKKIEPIIKMARNTNIDFINDNNDGSLKIFLDGRDVTQAIRLPNISGIVSDIAKIKEVRQVLLGFQRRLGNSRDSILDGRDIGTVVFPDADKKFYVDAEFKTRAARRFKELKEMGQEITLADVERDLENRDKIDSTRDFAPLKKADDAIYVDTTNMSIDEVVEKLYGQVVN